MSIRMPGLFEKRKNITHLVGDLVSDLVDDLVWAILTGVSFPGFGLARA